MKFKTYVLFYILFGIIPDMVITLSIARGPLAVLAWVPTLVALIYLVLIGKGINYTESLKVLSYLIFIFEFPKFVLCLTYGISYGAGPHAARSIALAVGIAVCLFFTVMIFIVTTNLRVTRSELSFKNLPPQLDALRICHLSDFHLGSFGKHNPYIKRIIDTVLAEAPDLILFSGDLVNFDSAEADGYMGELSRLKAPLGIFATRGNHDYLLHGHFNEAERAEDTERLLGMERSLGWNVLLNSNLRTGRGGAEIAIAGVENISANPYFPAMGGDLRRALEGIREGMFTILLSHDPTHWPDGVAGKAPVALTLSGHTHGLKFKLAGLHPSSWKFPHPSGIHTFGDQVLHVSVGLGSAFAFRLGGRPSVDILTLRTKQ